MTAWFIGFGLGVLFAALATWLVLRGTKESELAAQEKNRRLEHLAEVGAMTGGLAHEIKNPLSTLGLNAQLLAEAITEADLPDEQRSRLLARVRSMRREADRLSEILQDFLHFAGRIHVNPTDTDANTVVLDLVDFFLPEAERRGIRLRAETAPQPIPARFDVSLVKQAMLNLMLNAAQAMENHAARSTQNDQQQHNASTSQPQPNTKELILRTSLRREKENRRDKRKGENAEELVIEVIDTGPGIEPETLRRIFEPYFTTKAGGSGLGLPTSRRIIEEQGGRLEAHSEPGKGSAFSIVLPRYVTDRDGDAA